MQEEILHGMQANFCQFAALGRANARQGIERHSIQQTALHDLLRRLHRGPPRRIGFNFALLIHVG